MGEWDMKRKMRKKILNQVYNTRLVHFVAKKTKYMTNIAITSRVEKPSQFLSSFLDFVNNLRNKQYVRSKM